MSEMVKTRAATACRRATSAATATCTTAWPPGQGRRGGHVSDGGAVVYAYTPRHRHAQPESAAVVGHVEELQGTYTREGDEGAERGLRRVGDGDVLCSAGPHHRREHGQV